MPRTTPSGPPSVAAVDVFCGVGGLSYGLQKAGIPVVGGVDADPSCRYAFENNCNAEFLCTDIQNLEPKLINKLYPQGATKVLVGCAPCQSYSSYSLPSCENESWKLLNDFSALISAVSPDIVSMENVTRLKSFKQGTVYDQFVKNLENDGFKVSSYSVLCWNYGVPQTRRRLVLFGTRIGIPITFIPPTHDNNTIPTVRTAIGHLAALQHGEINKTDPVHRCQGLTPINLSRIKASKPGGTWEDWPKDLRADCHKRTSGRTYRNVYGRMEWDKPAPTITTGSFNYGRGRFGHPSQDRAISLREAALLQTFPEDYKFINPKALPPISILGRQIGNAVPVALGQAIGESIIRHIGDI